MIYLTSEFGVKKSLKGNTCEAEGYVKPLRLAVLCYGSTATYWLYVKDGWSHRDIELIRNEWRIPYLDVWAVTEVGSDWSEIFTQTNQTKYSSKSIS